MPIIKATDNGIVTDDSSHTATELFNTLSTMMDFSHMVTDSSAPNPATACGYIKLGPLYIAYGCHGIATSGRTLRWPITFPNKILTYQTSCGDQTNDYTIMLQNVTNESAFIVVTDTAGDASNDPTYAKAAITFLAIGY